MSSININGTSLEYNEQGAGPPLVFIHGSASDMRTWAHPQEYFRAGFRTIVYSRRYHWPNESIPKGVDYAMPQQVDDLQQVLTALNATPAHLVGHSYGAFLCLLLAIRNPELIQSLVLVEPPVLTLFVSNTPKPGELLKLLVTRPRTALSIIRFGAKGFAPAKAAAERGDMEEAREVFGKAVLGKNFYNQLSQARLEQIHANTFRTEFTGSGFAPIAAEDVQDIKTPALLINGRQSPTFFHRLMDGIEELLPHCERISIENASHIIHEDNLSAFTEAVESFLAEHMKTQ